MGNWPPLLGVSVSFRVFKLSLTYSLHFLLSKSKSKSDSDITVFEFDYNLFGPNHQSGSLWIGVAIIRAPGRANINNRDSTRQIFTQKF